jgi:hypothetical protein
VCGACLVVFELYLTVLSCNVDDQDGGDVPEVEEVSVPQPARQPAAELAGVDVAPLSPPRLPASLRMSPLSPESSLMAKYRKTWGPKFKPTNVLKTGLKGSTTDEREDFQTVLKGIAKKYLNRNEVVRLGYPERSNLFHSISLSLSPSLSLSLTPSRLFSCIILCWTLGCRTIRWFVVGLFRMYKF